jgi:hypothetical protein
VAIPWIEGLPARWEIDANRGTIEFEVLLISVTGTKLYLHCIGGQNRSPTVLWLYLISCGMKPDEARRMISEKSPDSVPGHQQLVDQALVDIVRRFGADHRFTASTSTAILPAY